jgi:hypothetical protein
MALLALVTALLFLAHHDLVAGNPDTAPPVAAPTPGHGDHGAGHSAHAYAADGGGSGTHFPHSAADDRPGPATSAHTSHTEAGSGGCAEAGTPCWSAKNDLALPVPAVVPAVVLPAPPVPAATRPDPRREPSPTPPDLAELSVLRI